VGTIGIASKSKSKTHSSPPLHRFTCGSRYSERSGGTTLRPILNHSIEDGAARAHDVAVPLQHGILRRLLHESHDPLRPQFLARLGQAVPHLLLLLLVPGGEGGGGGGLQVVCTVAAVRGGVGGGGDQAQQQREAVSLHVHAAGVPPQALYHQHQAIRVEENLLAGRVLMQ
jgi:hypothetical protein